MNATVPNMMAMMMMMAIEHQKTGLFFFRQSKRPKTNWRGVRLSENEFYWIFIGFWTNLRVFSLLKTGIFPYFVWLIFQSKFVLAYLTRTMDCQYAESSRNATKIQITEFDYKWINDKLIHRKDLTGSFIQEIACRRSDGPPESICAKEMMFICVAAGHPLNHYRISLRPICANLWRHFRWKTKFDERDERKTFNRPL